MSRDERHRPPSPRGHELYVLNLGMLVDRLLFLGELAAIHGDHKPQRDIEAGALRWAIAELSARYPSIVEEAQAFADDRARRRAAKRP